MQHKRIRKNLRTREYDDNHGSLSVRELEKEPTDNDLKHVSCLVFKMQLFLVLLTLKNSVQESSILDISSAKQ
jgi:hypothetical protein